MAAEENGQRATPLNTELSRDLGLGQLALLGTGMVVGGGVVVGIGTGLDRAGGGGLLLVLALNGLLAMLSAMSYAELASAIPKAGGAYNFARVAFGRGWSFLAGWVEWCGTAVAGSLYAWALALYLLRLAAALGMLPWEHHPDHVSVRLVALAVMSALAVVSGGGASVTGRLGAWITLAQLGAVAVIGLFGLGRLAVDPARWANAEPFPETGSLAVLATMGVVYVVFQGYVVISQAGDETIEPRRTLPRAILLTALVTTLTYMLAAVGTIAAVAPRDLGPAADRSRWAGWVAAAGGPDTAFGAAVCQLAPAAGPLLLAVVVACGATAALNAILFSATRALYAMGRDCMLPGVLARVSRRRRTPWVALLITWAVMAVIVWAVPTMTAVASLTSVMFLLLFLMVNLCCIRLRRRMGDELSYGYVMPLFPLVPLLAIAGNAALLVGLCERGPLVWIGGPCWVLLGILVYRFYGRHHVISTRDEIVPFHETEPPQKTGFRILLPVANPDAVLDKLPPTMRLAEASNAQVELLHMVSMPEQVPLADAARYMEAGREAMVEALLYLQSRFPVQETIRYCRHPARGILSAAREHQADLMILGWSGRSYRADVLFGTTLDPILEGTPCDTLVLRHCRRGSYRHVLVPFAGGPNSLLALRTASVLLDPAGGLVRVVSVVPEASRAPDADGFIGRNSAVLACPRDRFQSEVIVSRDVAGALADVGRDADLVVVGATNTRMMGRVTVTPLAEILARRLDCALVMVKTPRPVVSLLNRWI